MHLSSSSMRVPQITPEDNQYPDFVRGVNQRFTASPDNIYLPTSTSELSKVIEELTRQGEPFVVRSSGHCLEDFVYNDTVRAIIDLSQFNYVRYDRYVGAFEVGTATPLLSLYEQLYRRWGVTYPGGICYSVAQGGHVTGGGWGMLCRQLGLTIDYVCQIEVIYVDETGCTRRVMATDNENDPHHDLWWAHMGGGGGTFGVVTRFWLRKRPSQGRAPEQCLPSPPSYVYLSAIAIPWSGINREKFHQMMSAYTEYFAEHSDPEDPLCAVASFMVLTHRSSGALALVTQVDATDSERGRVYLEEYLGRFERLVETGDLDRPIGEFQEFQKLANLATPQRIPWLEATRKLATTNSNLTDPSYRQVYKSAYMRCSFQPHQVDSLYDNLTTPEPLVGASITLSSYGGQVNAVDSTATAYPHRSAAFKLMWMSLWTAPEEDQDYVGWNRRCYEDLFQHTGGVPAPDGVADGCYVNYPDRDLNDPERNRSEVTWAQLYWKDNYPRLQEIKRRYDPLDIFRHRQSVRLPSSTD